MGSIQPRGSVFKGTDVLVSGRIKRLHFQEAWYQGQPWLEYSLNQDSACLFFLPTFQAEGRLTGK